MKLYYPYPANDGKHKYYVITRTGRKLYFGAKGYSDFTIHKDPERKKRYIERHKKTEDWTKFGVDTAGWWSYKYLWLYPTKEEAYKHIKHDLMLWGYIKP